MESADRGSFRELRVWKASIELVSQIYKATNTFPKTEIYALVQQMRRAAVSVPSNIAEGHGRKTPKEFAMFLRNANGSIRELETQVVIAERLGYLDHDSSGALQKDITEVCRMLHGLLDYQQRR